MIMRLPTSHAGRLLTGCAAVAAAVLWALTLWPSGASPRPTASDTGPILPRPVPPGQDFERRLFHPVLNHIRAASPPDAPVLAGIAGRLPNDAIAMVRDDSGAIRMLAIGQRYRGWRLDSLSVDAALFTRGTQRVRSALPAGTDDPAGE